LPSGAFGRSLLWRPNPMNFARRKWLPPSADMITESPTDESGASSSTRTSEFDSDGPVTPEGGDIAAVGVVRDSAEPASAHSNGHHADVSIGDDAKITHAISGSQKASTGVLTFRPSPMNFARRRWISVSSSPTDSDSVESRGGDPRAHKVPNTWKRSYSEYTRWSDVYEEGSSPSDSDDVRSHDGIDHIGDTTPSSSYHDQAMERSHSPSYTRSNNKKNSPIATKTLTSSKVSHGPSPLDEISGTSDDSDQAIDDFSSPSDDDPSPDERDDPSRLTPQLRIKYNAVLPAIVPWKNALATPMTQYLRKSSSFCADVPTTTPHLVNAGWETASDASTD